jgi:hypothetical protein
MGQCCVFGGRGYPPLHAWGCPEVEPDHRGTPAAPAPPGFHVGGAPSGLAEFLTVEARDRPAGSDEQYRLLAFRAPATRKRPCERGSLEGGGVPVDAPLPEMARACAAGGWIVLRRIQAGG